MAVALGWNQHVWCALPRNPPSRMTPDGTIISAHLDSGMVAEYDMKGKQLWSVRAPKPWSASRLKNGNTLITATGNGTVMRLIRMEKQFGNFSQKDISTVKLYQMQVAVRLANGNNVISNWCVNGIKKTDNWSGTVQYFEITSDKKLVWALSQWLDPDLGPGSSTQALCNLHDFCLSTRYNFRLCILVLAWVENPALFNEKNVTYLWWHCVVMSATSCQITV